MDKTTGFKNGFVIPVNMLVKVAGVPEFIAKERECTRVVEILGTRLQK